MALFTLAGYVVKFHIRLYEINPVLVVFPSLLLIILVYTLFIGGRRLRNVGPSMTYPLSENKTNNNNKNNNKNKINKESENNLTRDSNNKFHQSNDLSQNNNNNKINEKEEKKVDCEIISNKILGDWEEENEELNLSEKGFKDEGDNSLVSVQLDQSSLISHSSSSSFSDEESQDSDESDEILSDSNSSIIERNEKFQPIIQQNNNNP